METAARKQAQRQEGTSIGCIVGGTFSGISTCLRTIMTESGSKHPKNSRNCKVREGKARRAGQDKTEVREEQNRIVQDRTGQVISEPRKGQDRTEHWAGQYTL